MVYVTSFISIYQYNFNKSNIKNHEFNFEKFKKLKFKNPKFSLNSRFNPGKIS